MANLKITVEENGDWYDWLVEGDGNARAPYCGTALDLEDALISIQRCIKEKASRPYNPKTRTEY